MATSMTTCSVTTVGLERHLKCTNFYIPVPSYRNAIRDAWRNGAKLDDLKGTIMYTTLFPDNECAQEIIEVGIAEVVYLSDKYHD